MRRYKVIVEIEYIAKVDGRGQKKSIRDHVPMPMFSMAGGGPNNTYDIEPVDAKVKSIKEIK